MKKFILCTLVLMLVISGAAFAAKSVSEAGKLGVGMFGTTPTVSYNFSDSLSGQIGLNYLTSSGAGAAGQLGVLGSVAWDMYKVGANTVNLGALLNYTSNFACVSGLNAMTIALTWGAETKLNPSLTVGLVLFPISYTSVSIAGATTTNLGVFNMNNGAGAGAGATLTGRLYL
ncbi:MAG: hypothetical protein AABZ57_03740 [Candidatus Margulisiibacteriota bacterium]